MRFAVVGAGPAGRACAADLARSRGVREVLVVDPDGGRAREAAHRAESGGGVACRFAAIDVTSSRALADAIGGMDVVIGAAPDLQNPGIAQAALRAGVSMVDMGGDPDVGRMELALDPEARSRGITIVPECGLAPGLSNVLVAHGVHSLDETETVSIRFGGLPQRPRPPLGAMLACSPHALIKDYVGRAAVLRDYRPAFVEPLTECEEIDLPEPLGRCEAFHAAGGASTLPDTFQGRVRSLDCKAIRYPGHMAGARLLRDLGFFDETPVSVPIGLVAPRDVTAALLASRLDLPDEPDLVVLRVTVSGRASGRPAVRRYELIDYPDVTRGLTALTRTTAFPASIVAQMIARGETSGPGAVPVEKAVPPGPFLSEMEARGMRISQAR